MSDFIGTMAATSFERVRRLEGDEPSLLERAGTRPLPVPLDLTGPGFDVIAEVKLASPTRGALVENRGDRFVVGLARTYAMAGAAAISVLTEETRFGGSMRHLEAVATAVELPVMRKDFLVDPIQVIEARAAGASGVLLIARMLSGGQLAEMVDLTLELGMFALVEVFDRSDLEAAAVVFDRDVLIGVNCRDLTSLEVDRSRLGVLSAHLPEHLPGVAESGMTSPDDVAHVAAIGYRAALIGSSLVTDRHAEARLGRFVDAGRDAVFRMSP